MLITMGKVDFIPVSREGQLAAHCRDEAEDLEEADGNIKSLGLRAEDEV